MAANRMRRLAAPLSADSSSPPLLRSSSCRLFSACCIGSAAPLERGERKWRQFSDQAAQPHQIGLSPSTCRDRGQEGSRRTHPMPLDTDPRPEPSVASVPPAEGQRQRRLRLVLLAVTAIVVGGAIYGGIQSQVDAEEALARRTTEAA